MQKKNKIILTGGHAATSALAVFEVMREKHKDWDLVWVGARHAFAKNKVQTLDSMLFPKLGVTCYWITTGKLQRYLNMKTLVDLVKIPVGFFQGLNIILKEKPSCILSFGGFSALPVVLAGWMLGVPSAIHEQTMVAGLANRLSSPFAKAIFLSRSESTKYFPTKKTKVVGLPLHKALLSIKPTKSARPVQLLITGGSRGSQILNSAVKEILPKLLEKYYVTHLTGALDEPEFAKFKSSLLRDLKKKYTTKASLLPLEMADYYAKADIVIGRSGAHTVAEVMALGKAAIFVPIPWVQMNEQNLNAALAKRNVGSLVLQERKLTGEVLWEAVSKFESKWKGWKPNINNKYSELDRGASDAIVQYMQEYVV